MIYLKNTREAQLLMIPKQRYDQRGSAVLTLKNKVDNQIILLLTNSFFMFNPYYFMMEIVLPNISSGEYEYNLNDSFGELATGILIIEDADKKIVYNKLVTYEQYN